jgi:hypothetical protein
LIALATATIRRARLTEDNAKQELLDQGRQHAEKSLGLARELELVLPMARSHITIGISYALAANIKKSEEHVTAGIKALKDLRQKRIAAHSLLEYGRILKGIPSEDPAVTGLAEKHLGAAKKLFQELKLNAKVKECESH